MLTHRPADVYLRRCAEQVSALLTEGVQQGQCTCASKHQMRTTGRHSCRRMQLLLDGGLVWIVIVAAIIYAMMSLHSRFHIMTVFQVCAVG
jgi:hypothetical protein